MTSNSFQRSEYACKKCGACCRYFRMAVTNQAELIKNFKELFGFELDSYEMELTIRGQCKNLVNNRCSIYEKRPEKCKEYICKRHTALTVPNLQLYRKRCAVCQNVRSFQKGTERDKQSVCGNCWVW